MWRPIVHDLVERDCEYGTFALHLSAPDTGTTFPFWKRVDDGLATVLGKPRRYSRHQIGAAVAHTLHLEE